MWHVRMYVCAKTWEGSSSNGYVHVYVYMCMGICTATEAASNSMDVHVTCAYVGMCYDSGGQQQHGYEYVYVFVYARMYTASEAATHSMDTCDMYVCMYVCIC